MITSYDVIGIGFGPANLALAIALEEAGFNGSSLFLERRSSPQWQPEMLLPHSDIQNHPCRDLVTPRNPRSRYTFMNFLFENGRLFEHLNLGIEFPLRVEYAQYVSWAAGFFADRVRYNSSVTRIEKLPGGSGYRIHTANGTRYTARSLVVAPGRTPLVPPRFQSLPKERAFHLTELTSRLAELEKAREIRHLAVLGGSQSAAEIVLYLRSKYPNARISNIMRGYGYRLKDTSQFSEQVYFPEFVDYYYSISKDAKRQLNRHLHYTNYSAVDGDVIRDLYVNIYEDRLRNENRIDLLSLSDVTAASDDGTHISVDLREVNTGERKTINQIDAVVLATGFRNLGRGEQEERVPPLLAGLADDLKMDDDGCLHIERDYELLPSPGTKLAPLYLNGLCESSHGYGDAGSFSLLALRAGEIQRSLVTALASNLRVAQDEEAAVAVG